MSFIRSIKKVVLFAACSLMIACAESEEVEIPENVLSSEKMAEVMVDVHLLEAAMNLNAGIATETIPHELDIFKSHNVSQQQYEESYRFYTEHPELMGEIYQIVLNELSKKQAEVANGK